MRVTSMANFGFNGVGNNYTKIKEGAIKKLASNAGLSLLASKIKKIINSAIAFVKKNPRNTATCIGLASMLVGVTTANPGLVCVGVSALVAATLYIPSLITLPPVHESECLSNCPDAG